MLRTSVINASLISSVNCKSALLDSRTRSLFRLQSGWNEGFSYLQKELKSIKKFLIVLFCATWTWYISKRPPSWIRNRNFGKSTSKFKKKFSESQTNSFKKRQERLLRRPSMFWLANTLDPFSCGLHHGCVSLFICTFCCNFFIDVAFFKIYFSP